MASMSSILPHRTGQRSVWFRFVTVLRSVRRFKSHWYYWYTGHKRIAVLSMMVSTLILWISLGATAGVSISGVVIAVLLDAIGFWLAIAYLLFLRSYIPQLVGLQGNADAWVVNQLIFPVLIGFFLTRITSFCVAKICGHTLDEKR